MEQLYPITSLKAIAEFSKPGLAIFINHSEKLAYTQISKDVSVWFINTIKKISQNRHKIKTLDGWEACYEPLDFKKGILATKLQAESIIFDLKLKGYKFLSVHQSFFLRGVIKRDYRFNLKSQSPYLFYVYLMSRKNQIIKPVAIFNTTTEGKEYIDRFTKKPNLETLTPTGYAKELTENYIKHLDSELLNKVYISET